MAAATLLGFVCSDLYVTQSLAELILAMPFGKWGIILFINVLLLILGCFMPPAAVILTVAAMLLPVIKGLGFDSVWFSLITTVNLDVGLLTPPVASTCTWFRVLLRMCLCLAFCGDFDSLVVHFPRACSLGFPQKMIG